MAQRTPVPEHPKKLIDLFDTPTTDRLAGIFAARASIALTGLNESLMVGLAAALCRREGIRVMVVLSNDLRAVRAGADARQLVFCSRRIAACLERSNVTIQLSR